MNWRHRVIRAQYAGDGDFRRRIPELTPLASKAVALVGLGSLGAPIAIELARSGIGYLTLVDNDIVDAGTCCRWPFGLAAAGHPKALFLEEWIRRNYPWTKVKAVCRHFGAVQLADKIGSVPSDFEVVEQITSRCDLLIDATAELGVQHFLSDHASGRGITYIAVSGTQGGWGGEIVRIRPRKTVGCWMCYLAAQAARPPLIPTPPAKDEPGEQPRGCGSPTFTGAGFDMLQVAVNATRIAASSLCEGCANAYPSFDHDVFVIRLRDEAGAAATSATFETFPLDRHQGCPRCS